MLVLARPAVDIVNQDLVPPVVEAPITFFLEPNEYQKLTGVSLIGVRWEGGGAANPFGKPSLASGSTGVPLSFPIILREADVDGLDRLVIRLPLIAPQVAQSLPEETHVDVRLLVTFRSSIEIEFILRMQWIEATKQFHLVSFRRATKPKTLYVNAALLVTILIAVTSWNLMINVAETGWLSRANISNAALIFGGFFGLSLANVATFGKQASALRGFMLFPELYFSRGSLDFLQMRATSVILTALLIATSFVCVTRWSYSVPPDVVAASIKLIDEKNRELPRDRRFNREHATQIAIVASSLDVSKLKFDDAPRLHLGRLRYLPLAWKSVFDLRFPRLDWEPRRIRIVGAPQGCSQIEPVAMNLGGIVQCADIPTQALIRGYVHGEAPPGVTQLDNDNTIYIGEPFNKVKRYEILAETAKILEEQKKRLKQNDPKKRSYDFWAFENPDAVSELFYTAASGRTRRWIASENDFIDEVRTTISPAFLKGNAGLVTEQLSLLLATYRFMHERCGSAPSKRLSDDDLREVGRLAIAHITRAGFNDAGGRNIDARETRMIIRLLLTIEMAHPGSRVLSDTIEANLKGAEEYLVYLQEGVSQGIFEDPVVAAKYQKYFLSRLGTIRRLQDYRERITPMGADAAMPVRQFLSTLLDPRTAAV